MTPTPLRIHNGRFVDANGDPEVPIFVGSVRLSGTHGGDRLYRHLERTSTPGIARKYALADLRPWLEAAWGPTAIFTNGSDPGLSEHHRWAETGGTRVEIRDQKLTQPIDRGKVSARVAASLDVHQNVAALQLVEPAWEGLATDLEPKTVARRISILCHALRDGAEQAGIDTPPLVWNESAKFNKKRRFTAQRFGEVLDRVLNDPAAPNAIGADYYTTSPETADAPEWWHMLDTWGGVRGIAECGWAVWGPWQQEALATQRAVRMQVSGLSSTYRVTFPCVLAETFASGWETSFYNWRTVMDRLARFKPAFIAHHSGAGHTDHNHDWIPSGPYDGLSGLVYQPSLVRESVDTAVRRVELAHEEAQ